MDRFKSGGQMRLLVAFLVTGVAASTAHASSIVYLQDSKTSPSSTQVGAPKTAISLVELGTPAVDPGKVAAVTAEPNRLGAQLMVIRGGEVGGASAPPQPARQVASTSGDARPSAQPLPQATEDSAAEPAVRPKAE
ncbi:MAG: hypothetical protein ABS59_00680 [Methylobacterium sp. SCN 67-24]|nr:MAG: hypothetical protein ABS59_00680 [Methylobacterium sp. SCN 67-24]